MHDHRDRRLSAVTFTLSLMLAATLLLSGCGGSGGLLGGEPNLFSVEEEWQLGDQLEQDLARELDLVRDRQALATLSSVGQQLVNQTRFADREWNFFIVDDDQLNAFTTPGGNVYVHTGLIEATDNVAELAGVMAHEIAHGVDRHGTEQLTQQYGLSMLAGFVLGENPAIYEELIAQVVGAGAVASFSRGDEHSADEMGVRIMYEAGYDPQGMVAFFREMLEQRERQPGSVQQFFSTHPLTEDRIDAVQNQIRQLPPKSGLITSDGTVDRLQARIN